MFFFSQKLTDFLLNACQTPYVFSCFFILAETPMIFHKNDKLLLNIFLKTSTSSHISLHLLEKPMLLSHPSFTSPLHVHLSQLSFTTLPSQPSFTTPHFTITPSQPPFTTPPSTHLPSNTPLQHTPFNNLPRQHPSTTSLHNPSQQPTSRTSLKNLTQQPSSSSPLLPCPSLSDVVGAWARSTCLRSCSTRTQSWCYNQSNLIFFERVYH